MQGNVILVVVVTSERRTGKTAVIRSPDASLANQATEAVKRWKFKPAIDKEGKPVSVLIPIEVTFELFSLRSSALF